MGDLLAAFAHDPQRAVTAVDVQVVDVGAERFADPEPVHRQQVDERVVAWRGEPGLDQQGAELVAVQAQGPGLGVDLRSADVGGWVPLEQAFEVAVAAKAAQRRQPPRHGGAHPSFLLHRAGEHLQMSTAHLEQAEPVVGAPTGEQAQVGRVAHPGVARVPGQEPGDCTPFSHLERVFVADKRRCSSHDGAPR
jgi:hypothetical protein